MYLSLSSPWSFRLIISVELSGFILELGGTVVVGGSSRIVFCSGVSYSHDRVGNILGHCRHGLGWKFES